MKGSPRILILGMVDSVHVARFIGNLPVDDAPQVFIVPTSPHRRVHAKLRTLVDESQGRLAIHSVLKFLSLPIWILDRNFLFDNLVRGWFIALSIRKFRPDLIHVMETQGGGYPLLRAMSILDSFETPISAPIILTLFGSDLYWFDRFSRHHEKLAALLPRVTVLSTECTRDLDHARRLGFLGLELTPRPVSGGLDPEEIFDFSATNIENRNIVLVKGYGGRWGLGHHAVEALGTMQELLVGREVVIFSAEAQAIRAAKRHLLPRGINYRVYPKFALAHHQMLDLFRDSMIYVGLSRTDGLPASMLEAMSQGAFPIQTETACTQTWIKDGVNGLVVKEDLSNLSAMLRTALGDSNLRRSAAYLNSHLMRERYSNAAVDGSILSYSQILKRLGAKK